MKQQELNRIVAAAVAEAMAKRGWRPSTPALTNDERVAIDRATAQVARMKPGQSRAPVTLEAAYAASNAMPGLGRIYHG